MPLISFLHKPFPAVGSSRKAVASAFAFGAFVAVFLYFFRPFGLGEVDGSLIGIALGYGAVTTGGMLFMQLVWPRFFPAFYSEDDWTVGREIAHTLGNIVLIAAGNLAFSAVMGFFGLSLAGFFLFLGFTLVVGAFPVTVGVLLRQNAYQRKYLAQSDVYNARIESQEDERRSGGTDPGAAFAKTDKTPAPVELSEEGGGRRFTCPAPELIAIEAADNYVKLHLRASADGPENNSRKSELLRITMAAAEEALAGRDAFFRSHRSWLVNLDGLETVEGNARGYRLRMRGMKDSVPVSRSRIEAFQAVMEAAR